MTDFPKEIIAVTNHCDTGGAEIAFLNVLRALRARGAKIRLITQKGGALWQDYKECTDQQLLLPFPYPSKLASWIHYFPFLLKASAFLKDVELRSAIFANDVYPLWAATKLGHRVGLPVYSYWQSEYVFNDDSCAKKWLRYGATEAERLMASEPVAAHANATEVLDKTVHMLNPVSSFERYDPEKYDREAIRQQQGISTNEKLAICVGRVMEVKGQRWLAENFLKTPALYENWKLMIVGPIEPTDQKLWDHLNEQDVDNRLLLLGQRRDIPELLAAADLAIFPGTFNESFGLSHLEAALMGLPLLAFSVGTLPYLLGEDYPGLFDVNARERLIEYWAKMESDTATQMTTYLAQKRLRERFSSDAWEAQFEAAFGMSNASL